MNIGKPSPIFSLGGCYRTNVANYRIELHQESHLSDPPIGFSMIDCGVGVISYCFTLKISELLS